MTKKILLFTLAFFIITVMPCVVGAQSENTSSGYSGYDSAVATEAPDITTPPIDGGYSYETTTPISGTDADKGYSYEATTSGEETGEVTPAVIAYDTSASAQTWVRIVLGIVTLGVLYLMYFIIREFVKKR